jgi:hypothetical protein
MWVLAKVFRALGRQLEGDDNSSTRERLHSWADGLERDADGDYDGDDDYWD